MRGWAAATRRSSENQTVINRIMLRFRPIAPKPVDGEGGSGSAEESRGIAAGRRVKRKYVRVRGRQSKQCAKRKVLEGSKPSPPEKSGPETEEGAVTLQLLEERSESERTSCEGSLRKSLENWTDLCNGVVDDDVRFKRTAYSGVETPDLRSVIETWVIVECVTDKFAGVGLGFSDKEKIYNLEQDTCPGFVSDSMNNVIWVNDAYKRMVAEDGAAAGEKGFLVWLLVKDELPHTCPSFACKVRITQQKGQGQKWNKIVPCDVWRLDFPGFAWKLDVNTALSLGF